MSDTDFGDFKPGSEKFFARGYIMNFPPMLVDGDKITHFYADTDSLTEGIKMNMHDMQMELQAMYQVIGAMVIEFEKTNACTGLTLDIESIGQNYNIHRVVSDQAPVVTYHAVVAEEQEG